MTTPQTDDWNGETGERWVRNQTRLDAWLEPLGRPVLEALELRADQRVLDIGCGAGQTTIELARAVGPTGIAIGVDISEPLIALARERAAAHPDLNLEFRCEDATRAELPDAEFDCVHSRFGVMFFDDPARAFANIRRAMAPGARMAFLCWQTVDKNLVFQIPAGVVNGVLGPVEPPPTTPPKMFSFADPDYVRGLLGGAGWESIEIRDVSQRCDMGTPDEAAEFFGVRMGGAARRLNEASGADRERALDALRREFESHASGGRVAFDCATWVVTAAVSR